MKRATYDTSVQDEGNVERRLISKGLHRSPLDFELVSFDDVQISNIDGTATGLFDILLDTQTDGLIFLNHGKVVYEYYNQFYNAQSSHKLRSTTKSMLGLVTGILVEQGKLACEDHVTDYVPELVGTAFETTTIRNCLDMRLGFGHEDTSKAYRKAAGLTPLAADDEPTDIRQLLLSFNAAKRSRPADPDEVPFDYTTLAADLLGWVLERASGMQLEDLISEVLWQPLGAQDDASIRVDPVGTVLAGGGISATLRDMARLTQHILYDKDGVVPAGWLHDMLNEGSTKAFEASSWKGRFSDISSTLSYRSNWIVDQESQILISAGAFGQMMIVDRPNQMAMVKLSSQTASADERKSSLTIRLFKEFQRSLIEREAVETRLKRQTTSETDPDVPDTQIEFPKPVNRDRTPQDREQTWHERRRVPFASMRAERSALRGIGAEVLGY